MVVEAGGEALTLTLHAVNQAGLETTALIELALEDTSACAEPGPEVVEAEPEADSEQAPDSAEVEPKASSGGCGAGGAEGLVWLLGALGLTRARRAARGKAWRLTARRHADHLGLTRSIHTL